MSKANSNAAATAIAAATAASVPAPVAAKEPSKMELARPIFVEVNGAGFELPEGKSARATFISRAVAEVGLTDKGAATYWQNLNKEAKGLPLYGKKKAANVEQGTNETKAAADDANEAADANAPAATTESVETVAEAS